MQTKGKAEHIRKLPEIVYDEVLSEQQTETEGRCSGMCIPVSWAGEFIPEKVSCGC